FPNHPQIKIVSGTLRVPELMKDELGVLAFSQEGGIVKRKFQFPPLSAKPNSVVGKWAGSSSHQSNFEFQGTFPLAEALKRVMSVRRVSAHRMPDAAMPLASIHELAPTGNNLAPFLQTLHGRARRTFNQIEDFVFAIFPEFEAINPRSVENKVGLTI